MSTVGRILTLDEVRARGDARGAIFTGNHVVLTEKPTGFFHAPGYFDKDVALSDPAILASIAYEIAKGLKDHGIQALVGPTYGAVGLTAAVAMQLYLQYGITVEAWGWAEQAIETVWACPIVDGSQTPKVQLIRNLGRQRVVRRCFPRLIDGKRTAVGEDIVSSGGSAEETIKATRAAGADVFGLAVVCDRSGGLKAEALDVERVQVLFDIPMEMFPEEECPLCADKVPINMQVGHGAAFYERHPDSGVPRGKVA